MTQSRLTIVVSGMIAADPHQGGATWAVLQYLLGFRRLGHDVYFVEPIASGALRPNDATLANSTNTVYFQDVVAEFGLDKHAALLLAGTRETVGLSYDELLEKTARADVLVNISGMLTDETLIGKIPARVYLDLDPGFIQLWHAVQGIDMRFAGHTHFVTIAHAIGLPDCPIPTCGRQWVTTWQPIVLEHWPAADTIDYHAFTTVGNWRGYGSVEHEGVFYGQKAHSWRRFITLPTLTTESFMPALGIHAQETKDLEALAANGWRLLDPAVVAGTPATYRSFIRSSKAELGIAKSGYVASRGGWFSDRSACYLASGRPVLALDTGFGRYLPTGAGLFTFGTIEEALDGIAQISSDYARHSRAARALAEEYFDSDRVLSRLLQMIGAAP